MIVNPDFIIDGHCHPFQEIPIASLDDWNTFDSFREKAYSLSLISGRDAIVRLTNEGEVIIHKKGDSNNAKARYGELPELDQMEINAESLFVRATGKRIALIGVGALGSHAAYLLSKLPLDELSLIDFDYVEGKNLSNQFIAFDPVTTINIAEDADKMSWRRVRKVAVLKETLIQHSPLAHITVFAGKGENINPSRYDSIILTTDSAKSRYSILKHIASYNNFHGFFNVKTSETNNENAPEIKYYNPKEISLDSVFHEDNADGARFDFTSQPTIARTRMSFMDKVKRRLPLRSVAKRIKSSEFAQKQLELLEQKDLKQKESEDHSKQQEELLRKQIEQSKSLSQIQLMINGRARKTIVIAGISVNGYTVSVARNPAQAAHELNRMAFLAKAEEENPEPERLCETARSVFTSTAASVSIVKSLFG